MNFFKKENRLPPNSNHHNADTTMRLIVQSLCDELDIPRALAERFVLHGLTSTEHLFSRTWEEIVEHIFSLHRVEITPWSKTTLARHLKSRVLLIISSERQDSGENNIEWQSSMASGLTRYGPQEKSMYPSDAVNQNNGSPLLISRVTGTYIPLRRQNDYDNVGSSLLGEMPSADQKISQRALSTSSIWSDDDNLGSGTPPETYDQWKRLCDHVSNQMYASQSKESPSSRAFK